MGWVRLDDRFPDNPKVEMLTDRAFRLHIRGLCYCSEHLTDGGVPRTVARRWGSPKSFLELFTARLWDDGVDGRYHIHDYLEYNPSREQVLARRAAQSANARARWSPASSPDGMPMALGDGYGEVRQKRSRGGFVHPLDRELGGDDG